MRLLLSNISSNELTVHLALTDCGIAGYGPGDQGAYNQFYERSVREARLTQQFNAKPYHEFSPSAYVVHFHGPKPGDYLAYSQNGTCAFGVMCKGGVDHAFCDYALEWAQFIQDEDIGPQVQLMCETLSQQRETSSSVPVRLRDS